MKQFFKFIFVGFANTAVGYGVIFACMYLGGLMPELSNAAGYLVGFFLAYFLNRHFTFRSNQKRSKEFVRFVLVFLAAYAANLLVVIVLFRGLEINAALSQVIAAVIYISISYILNKRYVFRATRPAFMNQCIVCTPCWLNIMAFASLIGIWAMLLWRAFDPAYSFAIFKDNEFLIGPLLSGISSALRGGELPLRLTTVLGGLPIYNLAQFSPFYPFYFSPFDIFKTPLEAANSMHWITLLHILLASVNMFILLRVIGTTRLAAVAGASALAFSSNSMAYAVWLNITAPYAWLPLYLAGLIGVLENRSSAKYPAMAIGGMVLLVFASPAQPVIHAVFLSCVLMLFCFWHNKSNFLSYATISILSKLAAIALVSFLLAAPAILPMAIEFREMIRWIGPFPPVNGFQKIPFNAFLTDQLSIEELGGVLVNSSRKAVGGIFVGPVALSLAVFSLFSRSRTWVVTAMALIALYALASSTGSNLGLVYVNYILPLVNKIREPSRFLYLFHLGLSILLAIGLDKLREMASGMYDLPSWRRVGIVGSIIALVSLVIWFVNGDRKTITIMPIGLLVALLLTSIYVARTSWPFRGQFVGFTWAASLIAIIATNVTWKPPQIAASDYLTNDCVALDIVINRVAELDPNHNYRLVFEGNIDKQMASMLASYKNVRTLNAYINPAPWHQFQELYHHGPRVDNYLQILGARYLICPKSDGMNHQGFEFLESINGYDIYQSSSALPYAYIAQKLNGCFESLTDFINKANSHDLSQGLLFIEPNATISLPEKISKDDEFIISEVLRKKNIIKYIVKCNYPSILIINEFYSENWKVTNNGIVKELLRVNGNQVGVQLMPGSQVIEFTYYPRNFYISIILALIGLVLLLGWILFTFRPNVKVKGVRNEWR